MADQLADLPPKENGNLRFTLIDCYSELRQIKWQINWQIYPPRKLQFGIDTARFLLRAQADQVTDQLDLPP